MDYSTTTHYQERSRTLTQHKASGQEWFTDIPAALDGRGEMPRPGDMLAATAASCMMSLMSLLARRKDSDPTGMQIEAGICEGEGGISGLCFRITMPPQLHHLRRMMETAAETCPVRKALSPALKVSTEWVWE